MLRNLTEQGSIMDNKSERRRCTTTHAAAQLDHVAAGGHTMAFKHFSTIPESDNSQVAYSQHGELLTIPEQLHMAWRDRRPTPKGVARVGNGYGQFLLKPSGGMWTSSLIGRCESAFSQLTQEFNGDHEWLTATRWRLAPVGELAVYVVDSDEDFGRLFRKDWNATKGGTTQQHEAAWDGDRKAIQQLRRMPSSIDWLLFSRLFDCLWARSYFPPAWDCESLFWTRWCFAAPVVAVVGGAE